MLSRIVKRKFCSGTPFHHDFNPGHFDKKPFDLGLAMFEFARIFFYVYFTFKVVTHSPSLIAFRKKNFLNNPDYMLLDAETFTKVKLLNKSSK
jgi:hypothetical protein